VHHNDRVWKDAQTFTLPVAALARRFELDRVPGQRLRRELTFTGGPDGKLMMTPRRALRHGHRSGQRRRHRRDAFWVCPVDRCGIRDGRGDEPD
jgi:hypothetical protein